MPNAACSLDGWHLAGFAGAVVVIVSVIKFSRLSRGCFHHISSIIKGLFAFLGHVCPKLLIACALMWQKKFLKSQYFQMFAKGCFHHTLPLHSHHLIAVFGPILVLSLCTRAIYGAKNSF